MQALINAVATRQTAGTPAQLLRWYNDHVNLLLRFEGLDGATLYRRISIHRTSPPEPDYLCLYRFASMASFVEFEASNVKELARQVTQTGWGLHGIEIMQRSQYLVGGRLTGLRSSVGSGVGDPLSDAVNFYIQCLDMTGAEAETRRWLADRLYLAAIQAGLRRCEWHTSQASASGQQQVIVLAAGPTRAGPPDSRTDSRAEPSTKSPATPPSEWPAGWFHWWADTGVQSHGEPLGIAPTAVAVAWQAGYQRMCEWSR